MCVAGVFTRRADPMTKAREGSQPRVENGVRNSRTFRGSVIPLRIRPIPNSVPHAYAETTVVGVSWWVDFFVAQEIGMKEYRNRITDAMRASCMGTVASLARGAAGLEVAGSSVTWFMYDAVIAADDMKVRTDAKERFDKRARPQMPWPLVQPLPRVVPAPTNKPATTGIARGNVKASSFAPWNDFSGPTRRLPRYPPARRPPTMDACHGPSNTSRMNPEIPNTFPLN